MNRVEPIRDITTVKDIARYLKSSNDRNYIMYILGIYSGLRISDILKLKAGDVRNKENITLRETKTRKQKTFPINDYLKKELKRYINENNLDDNDYLIKSRNGFNNHIHRATAYKIMREAGEKFGVENIGTHTLRKTFGYLFYMQTKDIVALQDILNHSDPRYTLIYIGLEQKHINEKMKKFKIF
ncbi:site-specific integrase [Clostridium botulinum D/C]|uniref:site-specific integrase n=1 Tax=Clostridium botulinum TaxID=1491 RepID=UPI001E533E53|nr:site-specific integrase [Clostridium botulinum]MCD3351227.1 site-specific integrase [Clostridium botulinum D/C]MCD3360184.1 site-specific integrase [Clostridium botulinum D/C]MCD3361713.1 site-specific integrase [Clostridium botulinum D/C]MCD3365989.1 site-specific integrase [Clostridium botulinum D/C]